MPATTQFFSGKNGFLQIDGVTFPMEEWSLEMEIEEVEVSNFMSQGFKSVLGGFAGGTVSASGPYNGLTPLPFNLGPLGVVTANDGAGLIGTFTFGVSKALGVSYSWPVLVTGATVSQKSKEKATLEIKGTLTQNPVQ